MNTNDVHRPDPLMEISVIVPVYNVAQYLSTCIESVLQQTFSDFELLLIDDGSTDESATICDRYSQQDKRIKVIHQKNAGVAAARRAGVETASGEYIYFVDSDDTIPANALESLYENISGHDMVVGLTKFSYDGGTSKIKHTPSLIYNKVDYIKALLTMEMNIAPYSRLIKRSLFDADTMSIPKEVIAGEDFIMNIRLGVKLNTCNVINAVVYNYNAGRQGSIINSSINTMDAAKLRTSLLLQPIEDAGLTDICKNEIIWLKAINVLSLISNQMIDRNDLFVKETIFDARRLKWNIKNSRIKLYFFLLRVHLLNKVTLKLLQLLQHSAHNFLKFIGKKDYGI